jgi:glucosamine-6-phosphate deaminase
MDITICESADELGLRAASEGAAQIRTALAEQNRAVIALAAGSSQIGMLAHLVQAPDIDWGNIIVFPLDEYVGLSSKHPASFRRYLLERFVNLLPTPLGAFHHLKGDAEDPMTEAVRVGRLIMKETLDVAFLGIGENGHLAFNDPPADLDTEEPFLVVDLEERCRQQQIHEGWFTQLDDVPTEAISISVHRILTSAQIICTVPEKRKADAVKAAVEGDVNATNTVIYTLIVTLLRC